MIKGKNVLFLSYDGMTDPLGQSQVLPYLIGLQKKGYNIRLISFEKPERFAAYRTQIQTLCLENQLEWHPLKYTKKPPLLSTIWDVQQLKRLVRKLHAETPIDLVHCRSYITALVGLHLKKKSGIPFLFDMRGFWADERVDGGIWNLSNPIFRLVYSFFKKKEIQFFTHADYTISLTNRAKEEILSWRYFANQLPKIQVIPCCVDIKKFDPNSISESKKAELRTKLGISSDVAVVGYVGSIGTWYKLPEMLDFFKVYAASNPTAIFLFVTAENPKIILEMATQKGIDSANLRIVSALYSEVAAYISLFSFSVFFIQSTFSKMASSPTKQGELMAMGIPVICNTGVGDTDWVVEKFNAGWALPTLNPEAYSKLDWSKFQFDSSEITVGANEFYALEKGVDLYSEVYEMCYGA